MCAINVVVDTRNIHYIFPLGWQEEGEQGLVYVEEREEEGVQ